MQKLNVRYTALKNVETTDTGETSITSYFPFLRAYIPALSLVRALTQAFTYSNIT